MQISYENLCVLFMKSKTTTTSVTHLAQTSDDEEIQKYFPRLRTLKDWREKLEWIDNVQSASHSRSSCPSEINF